MLRSFRMILGSVAILIAILALFNFSQRDRIPIKSAAFSRFIEEITARNLPENFDYNTLCLTLIVSTGDTEKRWQLTYEPGNRESVERIARLLKLLDESKVFETLIST